MTINMKNYTPCSFMKTSKIAIVVSSEENGKTEKLTYFYNLPDEAGSFRFTMKELKDKVYKIFYLWKMVDTPSVRCYT